MANFPGLLNALVGRISVGVDILILVLDIALDCRVLMTTHIPVLLRCLFRLR